MSREDPIATALNLSAGAEFHRCALQVNPHHYSGTYRGRPSERDETSYVSAMLDKAEELDITVLAVTDHNHVGGVDAIRAAAEGRGIRVFPGFELTSTEGIHVLCLYPPSSTKASLERFLGEFGIRTTEPTSNPCDRSFSELLALVRRQGGVSIATHVESDNGLFQVLRGQSRIRAWQDENLYAIQIRGSLQDLPTDIRQIVQNRNPDYARTYAPETHLAIAAVNARNVTSSDELAHPSASCWIKMSEISIEGLRQAFLDPGSRIRLHSEPPSEERSELVAMAWQSGFLDGVKFHFNPNLNVLVGGRGAGKSTVIESLRYVLGLEPVGEDARASHAEIVQNVLRSGTKISLLVRSHRPGRPWYRIEGTVPNSPVVFAGELESADVLSVTPEDIFSGVELYGQREIAELARNPEKRTRLLERFVDRDDSVYDRKRELLSELKRSRMRISEVRDELSQIAERLSEWEGLKEMHGKYREAGIEEHLKEQGLLVREERVLDTITERLQPLRSCLETLQQELPIDRTFLSPKALEGLPGEEDLANADTVLEQLSTDLERVSQTFDATLGMTDQGVKKARERFDARRTAAQSAYEMKLRELQKSQVDGEEFFRLHRRIEALRPLWSRQRDLECLEEDHRTHRGGLLEEWRELKDEEIETLERAAKHVTRKLKGRLRVQVEVDRHWDPIPRILEGQVNESVSEALRALGPRSEHSLTALAEWCRQVHTSESAFSWLPDGLGAQRVDELLMHIDELEPPYVTRIELNTAFAGESERWQAVEQLSAGQKATAVLLLLLLDSTTPLIIDQPEDDLDNRFMTREVVPRLREAKRRRQFLFATHNANIPVLGDAEHILGLSARGEADAGGATVSPEHMGSIDVRPVRELVGDMLEGGERAFELRRRKYNF